MKAKITHLYRCAPEGHTTITLDPGTIVEGALAEQSILDGHAIKIEDEPALETKVTPAPEIKAPASDPATAKKGRYRK